MSFQGYRRPDDSVGVRNYVLVMPSVVCANTVVQNIGRELPEVVALTHQHGCDQIGEDLAQTQRTLVGLGRNPNVAAALVVGLGCETLSAESLASEIAEVGKRVQLVTIQEEGGSLKAQEKGMKLAQQLLQEAARYQRVECDAGELVMGTQCGASDACSGITANPALGVASDLLVEAGGTVILSETMEFIGAEHLLAERAADTWVKGDIYRIVSRFEEKARGMGVDIRGAQPTPGNMAGGITTIEEKSLGCIYKGGTSKIREVVEYGQRSTQRGLVVMDTPGNDVESLAGMVGGGAQVLVFTTGRGTPVGSPIAPVIKAASNSTVYLSMLDNMDINAGTILEGKESLEEVGRRIFREVMQVASGKLTRAEVLGHREFSLNRIGPTL